MINALCKSAIWYYVVNVSTSTQSTLLLSDHSISCTVVLNDQCTYASLQYCIHLFWTQYTRLHYSINLHIVWPYCGFKLYINYIAYNIIVNASVQFATAIGTSCKPMQSYGFKWLVNSLKMEPIVRGFTMHLKSLTLFLVE